MRVLFYIEPLIMHNRPFHYWAWLGYSASVFRALHNAGKDYQCRFIVNDALSRRALAPYEESPTVRARQGHGLPEDLVVSVEQEPIRQIFNAPNLSILERLHRRTCTEDQTSRFGDVIRDRLGSFIPDIIITRTPVPHLADAFPNAVTLGTECGPFSRHPYPMTTFYDPRGLWDESIPSACSDQLLQREASAEEARLLKQLRRHFRPYFQGTTPFSELEADMRRRHRRLALLPLQFGGESGFDLNSPFRNQGEFLFHVLERTPGDVGVLAVEHPTAIWVGDAIDEETREYLKSKHPNLVFVDYRTADSAGQYLIHHVDYVISISSSLALQALLWSKPLVSVGWSHYRHYAAVQGVEGIDVAMDPQSLPSRDGALAWLLRYYYPQDVLALHDGEWLDRFFRRSIERTGRGMLGLDFYDPVAPTDLIAGSLRIDLPKAKRTVVPQIGDLLRDGVFTEGLSAEQASGAPGGTNDAWQIVGDGATVNVEHRAWNDENPGLPEPEGRYLRLVRRAGRGDPVFLLQRIPDVLRLAGALVTLEFWARSPDGAAISTYFYQQTDNTRTPCQGTAATELTLTGEWRRYVYTAALPRLDGGRSNKTRSTVESRTTLLGPKNHTEVVFCLPQENRTSTFDLAMVALRPGTLQPERQAA